MSIHDIPWRDHLCFACGLNTLRLVERSSGSSGSTITMECTACKATGTLTNAKPWRGIELPLVELRGLFAMAKIPILGEPIPIPNKYWGKSPDLHPWWLVKTSRGYVELGWRKRVLSIDWKDTDVRVVVTADDVTKDQERVHAYSTAKAVEYLTVLGNAFGIPPNAKITGPAPEVNDERK